MSPTLADVFAADPRAAVLRLLESAGTQLAAGEIKQTLVSSGVAKADADRRWSAIQRSLRAEPQVVMEGNLYRWAPQPPANEPQPTQPPHSAQPHSAQPHSPQPHSPQPQSAEPQTQPAEPQDAFDALDLLVHGDPVRARAVELGDMVRTALKNPDDREAAARLRQAEIDGVRALSELAGEVEELLANDVDPAVLLRRVRARAKRSGLEPIGRAGEQTAFDRRRHAPVAGAIRDGAPVTVVRPGYLWNGDGSSVVIGKAVVEE